MSEESDRSLVGLLYTDIVGSTFHAARLGDRAWRALLDEHDRVVRRAIREHRGREITTTGDGFVVVFDRPARALQCAWDIRKRLSEHDLQVRCGVHAGVVEGRGDDIAGLVVHTGARIAAIAEPGEILVSRTVTEIEAGSSYEFEDRGDHELKGVPGQWRLFALLDVPVLTPESRGAPRALPRRFAFAGLGALVVAIGLVWLRGDDDRIPRVGPGTAEGAAPGIAVLPFSVSGESIETWGEGMVSLLSTNLDGAGHLRAIDSRTVLAHWDRAAATDASPGLDVALEVALATGAQYAIFGSATENADRVRIAASVYEAATGARLGSSEVEGVPDSLFALVDAVTRDVLGTLLEGGRGEIPEVDLAALTTSSVPALKAYLDGEADFRASRFTPAIEAYTRATEIDSTFAMAWYRIAQALGWIEGATPRVFDALERAHALSDRLPQREAAIVDVDFARHRGYGDGIGRLRQVVRDYPDDAEARYLLGETLYHLPQVLGTLEETEHAFSRAVELDPTFTPYRIHLAQLAMLTGPDRDEAASRLAGYEELAFDARYVRGGRLALTLTDPQLPPDEREAIIDTLDMATLRATRTYLFHPQYWEIRRVVERRLADLGLASPHVLFWNDLFQRGHLEAALTHLDESGSPHWFPICSVRSAWSMGVPVPDDVLERHLAITPADTIASPRTACGSPYAVALGRRDDYGQVIRVHQGFIDDLEARGDTVGVRFEQTILDGMIGFTEWNDGNPREAERLLRRSVKDAVAEEQHAFWLAQLLVEQGRAEEAIPYYRILRHNPLADLYRAEAHEAAGEPEAAAEAYRSLLDHWTDPDPELRFFVDRARAGLSRVTDAADR